VRRVWLTLLDELALAQTALRTQRPPSPDPAPGWERFAASRLEWDAQAAVTTDLLFASYARWATSHGEPVLAEDHVLAWVTAHGGVVRTAPLSQLTSVQGVRVVV
jgi:hypothetical protein